MTAVQRIHPVPPMPGLFHLDVCHEESGEVLIFVCGDLDIATAPVLGRCLSDLLDADTPTRVVVVDLSAAPFVDVGAANLLLEARGRAAERGATLSLTGCTAQLVRLLHLIDVLDVFDLIPAQRACSTARGASTDAHTDVPPGNGALRPRRPFGSAGRGRGGHG